MGSSLSAVVAPGLGIGQAQKEIRQQRRGHSSPSCSQKLKDQAQPGERLSGERITGEGGWG